MLKLLLVLITIIMMFSFPVFAENSIQVQAGQIVQANLTYYTMIQVERETEVNTSFFDKYDCEYLGVGLMIGDRLSTSTDKYYCSNKGVYVQKQVGDKCNFDFECETKVCVLDICREKNYEPNIEEFASRFSSTYLSLTRFSSDFNYFYLFLNKFL